MPIYLFARDKNGEELILCASVVPSNNIIKFKFKMDTHLYLVKEVDNKLSVVECVGKINYIDNRPCFDFTPKFQKKIDYESLTGESRLRGAFWTVVKNRDGKLVKVKSNNCMYNSAIEPVHFTGFFSSSLFYFPSKQVPEMKAKDIVESSESSTLTANPLLAP